jgi:hypothetical protein
MQARVLSIERFKPSTRPGRADLHDEHTNNLFLQTRGLPKPATGDQAGYILQRLVDSSRPFGTTVVVKGDMAEINLKAGN